MAGADATVHRQERSAYWLGFRGKLSLQALEHLSDGGVIGGEGGGFSAVWTSFTAIPQRVIPVAHALAHLTCQHGAEARLIAEKRLGRQFLISPDKKQKGRLPLVRF